MNMTKLLERAIKKLKTMPDARQDEVGAILLDIAEQDSSSLRLSAAQQAEVRRRLANPEAPIAADDMTEFFRKLVG
jgi:hypothetical protein